jgi:hypothetical protein
VANMATPAVTSINFRIECLPDDLCSRDVDARSRVDIARLRVKDR